MIGSPPAPLRGILKLTPGILRRGVVHYIMEVCEMTMRELIESLNNTPLLRDRFDTFNHVLREDCGGANRRSDRVGDAQGKVSEDKVQDLPDGIRGVSRDLDCPAEATA
jgi:hypothetical protein